MYCHGGNKGAHLNFAITMYHPSAVPIAEAVEKIFDLYNERNPNQETSQQVPVSSGQLTCSPPRYLALPGREALLGIPGTFFQRCSTRAR